RDQDISQFVEDEFPYPVVRIAAAEKVCQPVSADQSQKDFLRDVGIDFVRRIVLGPSAETNLNWVPSANQRVNCVPYALRVPGRDNAGPIEIEHALPSLQDTW